MSVAFDQNLSIEVPRLGQSLHVFAITLEIAFQFCECEVVGFKRK